MLYLRAHECWYIGVIRSVSFCAAEHHTLPRLAMHIIKMFFVFVPLNHFASVSLFFLVCIVQLCSVDNYRNKKYDKKFELREEKNSRQVEKAYKLNNNEKKKRELSTKRSPLKYSILQKCIPYAHATTTTDFYFIQTKIRCGQRNVHLAQVNMRRVLWFSASPPLYFMNDKIRQPIGSATHSNLPDSNLTVICSHVNLING